MIGITSLRHNCADWFARMAASKLVTRDRLTTNDFDAEELRAFHQALHAAYRTFAGQHPAWTQRGFDVSFLRTDALTPLLIYWMSGGTTQRTPTGMDLARIWERKFGLLLCGADRVRQVVRLASAANVLLTALAVARSCASDSSQG